MSYYRFNQIVGRIQSSGAASYVPQGIARTTGKSAAIQRDAFTHLVEVAAPPRGTAVVRQSSGMATQVANTGKYGMVPNTPHYQKIMQMQDLFQKADGKLVWQKLGARDMIPYYLIWAGIGTGFVFLGDIFYTWIDPLLTKKK